VGTTTEILTGPSRECFIVLRQRCGTADRRDCVRRGFPSPALSRRHHHRTRPGPVGGV